MRWQVTDYAKQEKKKHICTTIYILKHQALKIEAGSTIRKYFMTRQKIWFKFGAQLRKKSNI